MNEWNEAISEIKAGLEKRIYCNETAVSQSIVRRIIGLLGWDVNNPLIVQPEYSCGNGGRVDYALLNNVGKPMVLVEVKAVGLIKEGVTEQLIRYAFGAGAPIMVLTDGQEWHFFYAAAGNVSMNERRFYKIDLLDRSSEDIHAEMEKYIGYEAVISEKAVRSAEEAFSSASMKRKAKQSLAQAFRQLIDSEDEMLYEAVSEKVADLSGVTPDKNMVFEFLRNLETKVNANTLIQPDSHVISPVVPNRGSNHHKQRSSFRMLGVPVGSILTATFDPSHTFQTVDEQNKIQDMRTGEIMPISGMAASYLGGSRNGYEYFCFNGRKLSEIRQEFDKNYLGNRKSK